MAVVVVALAFVGVGGALCLTPITSLAMTAVPPERAGMASGIMSAQRALGSTAGFAIMGSVLAAVVAATLPGKLAPYLPEPGRQEAAQAVVDGANPRAVVGLVGPGRPLPDAVAQRRELVDAADDAFVDGIRAALAVGGVLSLAVLVAGYLVFPKGVSDETTEEGEAARLKTEEDVP
jgi:hypothetical protein